MEVRHRMQERTDEPTEGTAHEIGIDYDQLRRQDRITVERDSSRIEVYNYLNVQTYHSIRPLGTESYQADIGKGDMDVEPDYVTKWVAKKLYAEHAIDLRLRDGIEVVDVTNDDVEVL
jgi:GNAT superfamily N-acetyltransferase